VKFLSRSMLSNALPRYLRGQFRFSENRFLQGESPLLQGEEARLEQKLFYSQRLMLSPCTTKAGRHCLACREDRA
jgi:hypothetical protein